MGDQERVPEQDPACLLKAEFIALVSGTVLANEAALRQHVSGCPACRRQYEVVEGAAGRLRATGIPSEAAPLGKSTKPLRRWLPESAPASPPAPTTSLPPRTVPWYRKGLARVLGPTPKGVIVGIGLLLFVTVAFGATTITFYLKHQAEFRQVQELRARLRLDRYVEFASATPEHPSTDPKKARPLAIVDRDVILQGKVLSHLIERIEFVVEPGLEKGQAQWKTVLPIQETDKEVAVPFVSRFTAPADGILRKVTVRLVARPEGRAIDPHGLSEERLTYVVRVACQEGGVMAYVREAAPGVILGVQRVPDDRLIVTVQARTHAGSYLTIGFGARGAARFVPVESQRVSYYGEKLTFFVMLGADDEYDIRAFTLEQGERDDLARAVMSGQTEKLLVSDRKTIKK
jgi:hypothetical protein